MKWQIKRILRILFLAISFIYIMLIHAKDTETKAHLFTRITMGLSYFSILYIVFSNTWIKSKKFLFSFFGVLVLICSLSVGLTQEAINLKSWETLAILFMLLLNSEVLRWMFAAEKEINNKEVIKIPAYFVYQKPLILLSFELVIIFINKVLI